MYKYNIIVIFKERCSTDKPELQPHSGQNVYWYAHVAGLYLHRLILRCVNESGNNWFATGAFILCGKTLTYISVLWLLSVSLALSLQQGNPPTGEDGAKQTGSDYTQPDVPQGSTNERSSTNYLPIVLSVALIDIEVSKTNLLEALFEIWSLGGILLSTFFPFFRLACSGVLENIKISSQTKRHIRQLAVSL